MVITLTRVFTTTAVLACLMLSTSEAQPRLIKDYRTAMEIPGLSEVASSVTHLYTLSEDEGLSVFRTNADTLQYLYTNPGMQQRGDQISADARFAYLFGDEDERLTVLEPTSVLGVYSSTYLPEFPKDAHRHGTHLLVAMGNHGLGHLSLATPETVDREPTMLIDGGEVTALAGNELQSFALVGGRELHHFQYAEDSIAVQGDPISIEDPAENLFYVQGQLWSADADGHLRRIDIEDQPGTVTQEFEIPEPVERMDYWNGLYVIRSTESRIWLIDEENEIHRFRDNPRDGNLFTVSKSMLWMSEGIEFVQLHREDQVAESPDVAGFQEGEELQLASIDDIVIPQSRPLLLPIELETDIPEEDIRFRYQSRVDNAEIRGRGFYWQPASRQLGRHEFTIVASTRDGRTDTTSFEVDVKRFNSPPRFTPVRPITIPAEDEYTMTFEARDPDGTHPDLIRYIGVDLPEGAEINERTGEFSWTPHRSQVGNHTFEVIGTDQYGAASNLTVDITVRELQRN